MGNGIRNTDRRTVSKRGYEKAERNYGKGGKTAGRSAGSRTGKYGAVDKIRSESFVRSAGSERAERAPRKSFEEKENLLIGRNPVTEAIKAGRPIDKILMQKDITGSAKTIGGMAREKGIQVQYVEKVALDRLSQGKAHQGVAAYVAAHSYVGVEDILEIAKRRGEDPLVVILDGLEDPHNLGAVLRSCDGAGAHGVIIPSRRSVSLTETVAKASAGAIEWVPVAKTGNLSQTIELLKKKGLWIAAVDMDGENYKEAKLSGPLAIVIGGEGSGVSRLVKEKADYIVSIPMKGHVNSLNASNAAAIVLYESAAQRG